MSNEVDELEKEETSKMEETTESVLDSVSDLLNSEEEIDDIPEESDFIEEDEVDESKVEKVETEDENEESEQSEELENEEKETDSEEDEVDEEESSEEDENKSKDDEVDETDNPVLKAFAEDLVSEGIISQESFKEFDGSVESLFKIQAKELEAFKNSYKESLPPVIKDLVDNYEEGVPLDELIGAKSNEIELNSIGEESLKDNEELQEDLYRNSLKIKGFSKEKIDRYVKRAKETAELEEEAKDSLNELKDLSKKEQEEIKKRTKLAQEQARKEREESLASIKSTIDNTDEIVPSVKLTKEHKTKLYDILTKPVATDKSGRGISAIQEQRAKNPVKFDLTLAELQRLGVFEGNWEKLSKVGEKKSTNQLSKVIKSGDSKRTGRSKDGITIDKKQEKTSAIKDAIKLAEKYRK